MSEDVIYVDDVLSLVGNSQLSGSLTAGGRNNIIVCTVSSKTAVDAPAPTYGGVSMTEHASSPVTNSSKATVHFFYTLSPPPGTATIATTGANNKNMALQAVSFSGVDQDNPFFSMSTNTGNAGGIMQLGTNLPLTSEGQYLYAGGTQERNIIEQVLGDNVHRGDAGAVGYGFGTKAASTNAYTLLNMSAGGASLKWAYMIAVLNKGSVASSQIML